MQHLEVSGAVRPIYVLLGVKRLTSSRGVDYIQGHVLRWVKSL